ncbi:PAS domain-containing sensor histidine kinase [Salinibaculum rarum]|uniref:sensor histidine kinase n=1 Tax=Salinibaculum rarum TaxID=3058903 RepID=UPI00265E3744|nr:PAS domain-containing sensor histidine kinase [Salinibaculum sp. KK48]
MQRPGSRDESPDIGSEWPLADSTQIRLLYVGTDEDELGAVASYAAREYDELTLVTNTDPTAAVETVQDWPFDCVVVESDQPEDDWLTLLRESATPTILYTSAHSADIDDEILESVETVVGKESEGRRSLFAKVLGIVGGSQPKQATGRAGSICSLEADRQHQTGCFLVNRDGRVHWSNVSLRALFGTQTPGRDSPKPTHFYRRLAAIFEGGPETALDLTTLLASNRVRHGKVIRAPVGDRVEYFVHSSYPVLDDGDVRFEILEPVSSQIESYDSVQLFEELAANAVDGLFALDADGYIEYCNHSYAEMAGYDRAELLGDHVSKTMAEGELERAQQVLTDILSSDRESGTIDMTIATGDGDHVEVSYHFKPRQTVDGEYGGLIGVVRDITERKAREQELEQYRTLVESAGDPMYVFDESGHIKVCNEAMVEFTGLSRTTLRGLHLVELLPRESIKQGNEALERILTDRTNRWESFEVWLTDSDGYERLFEVTVGPIQEHGDVSEWVATLRDVTDRHRKQQQIQRIKQVFARSLRHNIRNKTAVINGFAAAIEDSVSGENKESVERIRAASEALATTSEKVSNLEWIVGGDFEQVDHELATLVSDSIRAARDTEPAATIETDLPECVRVTGIRDLDFAFRNLIENALEHGHDGTPPTVTVEVTEADDEWVTVSVTDDGPGIPDHEVRVIERGEETALEHASGLGLWLVDQVIEQSGGDLQFEVEDGTRASVKLRRAHSE